jgi:hypothetical protein
MGMSTQSIVTPDHRYRLTAQWRRFSYRACLPNGTVEHRTTQWEEGPFVLADNVRPGDNFSVGGVQMCISELPAGGCTLVQPDPERAPRLVGLDDNKGARWIKVGGVVLSKPSDAEEAPCKP